MEWPAHPSLEGGGGVLVIYLNLQLFSMNLI